MEEQSDKKSLKTIDHHAQGLAIPAIYFCYKALITARSLRRKLNSYTQTQAFGLRFALNTSDFLHTEVSWGPANTCNGCFCVRVYSSAFSRAHRFSEDFGFSWCLNMQWAVQALTCCSRRCAYPELSVCFLSSSFTSTFLSIFNFNLDLLVSFLHLFLVVL